MQTKELDTKKFSSSGTSEKKENGSSSSDLDIERKKMCIRQIEGKKSKWKTDIPE